MNKLTYPQDYKLSKYIHNFGWNAGMHILSNIFRYPLSNIENLIIYH